MISKSILAVSCILSAIFPGCSAAAIDSSSGFSNSSSIVRRGLCTPTGPGVCNLGYTVFEPPLSELETEIQIFDRYCNQIGEKDGPQVNQPIDSQLPYTVIPTWMEVSFDEIGIAFKYAADSVDSRTGGCSCGNSGCGTGGLTGSACCQCAFDC